jgi:hypothetical protein
MEEVALTFDRNGYLIPYDILEVKWNVVVQTFGYNARRKEIISAYEDFLASLFKLMPVNHRQWIDGSFVSQQAEPGDIDVIIFVPYTHFASITAELKQLKNDVAGLVDCYFVETFPSNHFKFDIGRADQLDWYHFLHTDRRKRPKGILELWFDYGNK